MARKHLLIALAAAGALIFLLDRWPPATAEGNELRRKVKDGLKLSGMGAAMLLVAS